MGRSIARVGILPAYVVSSQVVTLPKVVKGHARQNITKTSTAKRAREGWSNEVLLASEEVAVRRPTESQVAII
jgi:hypothetical protein